MPVIGSGMLAKAFLREGFGSFEGNVVYCSGVSNSKTSSSREFERDRLLLREALEKAVLTAQPLLYFGTCAVFDSLSKLSPYVSHKKALEDLVMHYSRDNVVIRLPQVVGVDANPYQLIPFLIDAIRNQKRFDLMTVDRNLVFVGDVVMFCKRLMLSKRCGGGVYNFAAKTNVSMFDIIQHISEHLSCIPVYNLKAVEQIFDIPVSEMAYELVPDIQELAYWKNTLNRVL